MTREQVRRVDQWAIQTLGMPGVALMENAGRNAADAVGMMLEDATASRVAVLAGAGNNGGDGFVVARHLDLRDVDVDVYLLSPREKIVGNAKTNLDVIDKLGLNLIDATDWPRERLKRQWGGYDLLVDALGGTGIRGAMHGQLAEAVAAANDSGPAILAIDIPTGLDCDTGEAPDPTIRATSTITFVAMKAGFEAVGAEAYTGTVIVADIGAPADRREG